MTTLCPTAPMTADLAREIDSHRSYLMRAARSKLREACDVEDVVQETIVAAWNGRAGFRGQSSLRTWLTGILHHKIVDAIRERQRRPLIATDAVDTGTGDGADDHDTVAAVTRSSEGAAAIYERRRFCIEVLDQLEAYSPKAAEIFVLREIDGEDTGAICRQLNVSSANCYVLLHRARAFLNERFAMAA
jgi:RNA polymerase sigma-70 factor (ECF subfamily)